MRGAHELVLAAVVPIAEAAAVDGVQLFHAGTRLTGGITVTSGGRVLAVTALGSSVETARTQAYRAASLIQFEGCHYRRDIALLPGSA